MTDYADLEKRLRLWSERNTAEWNGDPRTVAICTEAADALASLTRELEERDLLVRALRAAGDKVEALAFRIPPPNAVTPDLVALAKAMYLAADNPRGLSRAVPGSTAPAAPGSDT